MQSAWSRLIYLRQLFYPMFPVHLWYMKPRSQKTVQDFLDRRYKRQYISARLNIRVLLEKQDRKLFRKISQLDIHQPIIVYVIKIVPVRKEEAWKNQGFNGIRTRDLRYTGAMRYQLSWLHSWLHGSVGRASHRYRGGHGFESRWSPDFLGFFFSIA